MLKNTACAPLVRASVAAVLGSATMLMVPVMSMAADQPVETELEEVQVTGSRIVRRDLESNSPLVTVDSAALEERSGLNIESYLNQLPNYNPAASPNVEATNQDVQISSINAVGIASVSLRGLGANRSLSLIDGRRTAPSSALMVVDINGIPSSMIKRVEIISGGASATYGADAIGGVSNFMLRRDFEGLEVDAQYGINEVGDGQTVRGSAILGTKFGDNRGNLVFASEFYESQPSYDKNRSFYTKSYSDPSVGGNFIGFVFGANGYLTGVNSPYRQTLETILSDRPAGTGVYGGTGTGVNASVRFIGNGNAWAPVGANVPTWISGGGAAIDDFNFSTVNAYDTSFSGLTPANCNSTNVALCPTGSKLIQQVKYNETEAYTASPQTRYAFMASGTFDLTDDLKFFSSARFAQSHTRTYLAGTNASNGWEVTVPYNATTDSPVNPALNYRDTALVTQILANPGAYANPNYIATGAAGAQHPVPVEMAVLLNSRATNPLTSGWVMETYPWDSFGRRATDDTHTGWTIELGLNYQLPWKDWTSEVYYSRGEVATYNIAYGSNSLARWRGMVQAADYGRNANLQSNLTNNGPGNSPGFGSVAVHCTSGFYATIFNGDAKPSDDCLYAVAAPLQTRSENRQDVFELNLQGGLFSLPAGEVRTAVGFQQRRNASTFNPDILQSTASFTDQVIGVYPTGYLQKQIISKDVYGEFLVPVLTDSFLKKVELELGIRKSDYSATKGTTTFKINGNVQVNDNLRFRGGFNRSVRAPNLGELFLPLQQIFTGGAVYGDPCGLVSNAPFGAGGAAPNPNPLVGGNPGLAPGQTQEGAQSAYLICRAQMGAAGADFFYTNDQPGRSGAGGFAWVNQIGNPNLKAETADTWTAGVVFRSPFEHPLLSRIQATVDYYKIDIDDTILPYSLDYARFLCYGAVTVTNAAEAAAQAASPACQNNVRNQSTGGLVSTQVSYDNQAIVKTAGVDFTLNWAAQLEDMGLKVPGGIGLSVQGTYLDTYKTKQSPAVYDPLIEWKGTLGPSLQSFNAGAYDYRLFTSLSYNLPSFSLSLRWRHLPEVMVAGKATERAIIANNAAYNDGDTSKILLGYTPSAALNVPQYDAFDLSGFWTINNTLSLRFGIDNVFDVSPSSTGRSAGRPYNTALSAAENAAIMAAVCPGPTATTGCSNPTAYSLASSGQGSTSGGFYDVYGRRYYIGVKAKF